jgi:hypothetical protein
MPLCESWAYSYAVTKIELLSGSSQKGTSSSGAPNNFISAAKLLEGINNTTFLFHQSAPIEAAAKEEFFI